MPALPANSLIVVTGVTGYIGSHTALAALQEGYRVRGTVRDAQKVKSIIATFAKQEVDLSKLEVVILDNLTNQESYEKVLIGADGVAHIALDMSGSEMVQGFIDSNLALLRAAINTSTIKRVVLCSTLSAVMMPGTQVEKVLTGEEWDEGAVSEWKAFTTEEAQANFWVSYAAGKTSAEQAAYKWVEDKKPTFDLASVLPVTNFGPPIYGEHPSTSDWIHKLLHNDASIASVIPPLWYVDARDCGRLHVRVLSTEKAAGKRVWAAKEPFGWNQVMAIPRKNTSGAQIPEDIPGEQGAITDKFKVDNDFGTELFGGSWISMGQSITETAKAFGF